MGRDQKGYERLLRVVPNATDLPDAEGAAPEVLGDDRDGDLRVGEFMLGAWIAIRTTCVSRAARARAKLAPNFESWSQTSICGASPSKVAFRARCAHHASVGV
jgi:hypothetical protein